MPTPSPVRSGGAVGRARGDRRTRGDPVDAARDAEAAWDAAAGEGDDRAATLAATLLARSYAMRGDPERARTWLRHARATAERAPPAQP